MPQQTSISPQQAATATGWAVPLNEFDENSFELHRHPLTGRLGRSAAYAQVILHGKLTGIGKSVEDISATVKQWKHGNILNLQVEDVEQYVETDQRNCYLMFGSSPKAVEDEPPPQQSSTSELGEDLVLFLDGCADSSIGIDQKKWSATVMQLVSIGLLCLYQGKCPPTRVRDVVNFFADGRPSPLVSLLQPFANERTDSSLRLWTLSFHVFGRKQCLCQSSSSALAVGLLFGGSLWSSAFLDLLLCLYCKVGAGSDRHESRISAAELVTLISCIVALWLVNGLASLVVSRHKKPPSSAVQLPQMVVLHP